MICKKQLAVVLITLSAVMAASCVTERDRKETEPDTEVSEEETVTDSETSEVTSSDTETETTETRAEEIIDTSAPMWLEAPDTITVESDTDFDIGNYLSYIDDYDSVVDMDLAGEVDTSVTGDYPVTVSLTDDAGNSTFKDITVKVIEPVEPVEVIDDGPEPATNYYDFNEFVVDYAGEGALYGIDISKYQGDVDFEKVKAAGCDFVIMRAMVYYQGELRIDDRFQENLTEAKAAGLKVGVYIYTFANTPELVKEQTDALCELLNGEQLDFPVVFDWEKFSNFQQYNLSMAGLRELYQVFKDELAVYGYDAMLYSSKYYLETIWQPENETVWLAHYTEKTSYEGNYVMWQANCNGTIDGIEGPVDLDLYYGG